MGVKDVSIIEQHVEKMVLALAAAGAVFMGFLAFQKVTIEDTAIGPNDVEPAITREIETMEQAMQRMNELGRPQVAQRNYLAEYQRLAMGDPLPPELAKATRYPSFAPRNTLPERDGTPVSTDWQVVTPQPVAPFQIRVELFQKLVAAVDPLRGGADGAGLPVAVAPVDPALGLPLREQTATIIDGFIPIGLIRLELAQIKEPKERMPQLERQRPVIYRIRVQRRERTASGWGPFLEVTPTKASPSPTDINFGALPDDGVLAVMDQADTEFKQIVLPSFYLDETGQPIQPPILGRPVPPAVVTQIKQLQDELARARTTTGQAAPGVSFGVQGVVGGGLVAGGGLTAGGGMGAGGVGVPGVGGVGTVAADAQFFPTEPTAIKALEVIPFTFWDETVEPDHVYQYEVKVDFMNPNFLWQHGLKNPDMKSEPILSTGWVRHDAAVTIHSDIVFFVTGTASLAGGRSISVNVYKKYAGNWYRGDFTVEPGMNIAGRIELVDQGPLQFREVDTNYTLVDVQPTRNGARVVLKDPSGNLVSRDSAVDRNLPEFQELFERSVKRTATAVTTAPGTEGQTLAPAPVPVTPVTPTPTRTLVPVRP